MLGSSAALDMLPARTSRALDAARGCVEGSIRVGEVAGQHLWAACGPLQPRHKLLDLLAAASTHEQPCLGIC